jgi:hypothetical protein
MVESPSNLPQLLKAKGRTMPRRRYQRPTVRLWAGKSGEKFWKAEWRQYIAGCAKPKHRAMTWPAKQYTKSQAQEACDQLVREETQGGAAARPDSRMLVRNFWTKVFWPIAARRLSVNSKSAYGSTWRLHIDPAIGRQELQHVVKHAIEAMLGKMADDGLGYEAINHARMLVHEIFEEALENRYVISNPARKIRLPRCKPPQETAALTEEQVRAIFESTEGRERLMWRILLLTGCRPGELFALTKTDLVPAGLVIDEAAWYDPLRCDAESSLAASGRRF